jgi:hypothetical protein
MSADVTATQVRILHPQRYSQDITPLLCLSLPLKGTELCAIFQRILSRYLPCETSSAHYTCKIMV